jgi:hypothetical protein
VDRLQSSATGVVHSPPAGESNDACRLQGGERWKFEFHEKKFADGQRASAVRASETRRAASHSVASFSDAEAIFFVNIFANNYPNSSPAYHLNLAQGSIQELIYC